MIVLPVFNFIGNWLYEANKVLCEPETDDSRDSEDFRPGVLFDIGASWVILLKTLMIPEYARKGLPPPISCPLGTCGGPCPESDTTSSGTCDSADSSSDSSTTSKRCKKASSSCAKGAGTGAKKKKSKFSFTCD